MKTYVLMNGYGLMSFCTGVLLIPRVGRKNLVSLFCDTKYEDEDTYKWGRAVCGVLGITRIEIADGRDPWQLFKEVRMIGNSRIDPCSRILKRELARKWMEANYPDPTTAVVVVGIHAEESHRLAAIRANWAPYEVESPLAEGKVWGFSQLRHMAFCAGLWEQQLYRDGFPHANCGGRCVKQGHGGFIRLLELRPDKYAEVEAKEEEMRQYLGKNVAVMKEVRGGVTRPLTFRELRERVQQGRKEELDTLHVGGCGCFVNQE